MSAENKNDIFVKDTDNPAQGVKIGVLTSGGDAQGMNAVLRAVVRTAIHEGASPYAIREGWKGAVEGGELIQKLEWSNVSNILDSGGTAIGTARCDEFRERAGISKKLYRKRDRPTRRNWW